MRYFGCIAILGFATTCSAGACTDTLPARSSGESDTGCQCSIPDVSTDGPAVCPLLDAAPDVQVDAGGDDTSPDTPDCQEDAECQPPDEIAPQQCVELGFGRSPSSSAATFSVCEDGRLAIGDPTTVTVLPTVLTKRRHGSWLAVDWSVQIEADGPNCDACECEATVYANGTPCDRVGSLPLNRRQGLPLRHAQTPGVHQQVGRCWYESDGAVVLHAVGEEGCVNDIPDCMCGFSHTLEVQETDLCSACDEGRSIVGGIEGSLEADTTLNYTPQGDETTLIWEWVGTALNYTGDEDCECRWRLDIAGAATCDSADRNIGRLTTAWPQHSEARTGECLSTADTELSFSLTPNHSLDCDSVRDCALGAHYLRVTEYEPCAE